MNIFVLDQDPNKAARYLCDRHVVKMTLETAQILASVSHLHNIPAPYRLTHKNHPCIKWASLSFKNWEWVVEHGKELCLEYTRRYRKIHASLKVIDWIVLNGGFPKTGSLTQFVQAMPEKYRQNDPVEAYRNYYVGEKKSFATWKSPAIIPEWFRKYDTDQKL